LVSASLIDRCVEAAEDKGAVVVGLPVRDTIKMVSEDRRIQSTPERSSLWEIQTPQVFKRELIVDAHERAERDGVEATDDAMLVERLGKPVFIIDGERTNLKITVPEDVWLAESLIREGRVP
jgi:2-C-methyl-D-erythritol 4-phosphate cytidylyltransferase